MEEVKGMGYRGEYSEADGGGDDEGYSKGYMAISGPSFEPTTESIRDSTRDPMTKSKARDGVVNGGGHAVKGRGECGRDGSYGYGENEKTK